MNPSIRLAIFFLGASLGALASGCLAETESSSPDDAQEQDTTAAPQAICGPTSTRPGDVAAAMWAALGHPSLAPGVHGTTPGPVGAGAGYGPAYGYGTGAQSPYGGPFGVFSLVPGLRAPATGGCGP